MAFQVGQKVICINDTPMPGQKIFGPAIPRKGCIYTVIGFRSCRDGSDGLVLDIDKDWQYFAWRFRPIVERKTDISVFTKMLTSKKVGADT